MRYINVFDLKKKEDTMLRLFTAERYDLERFENHMNFALEFIQEHGGKIIDVDISRGTTSYGGTSYFGTITYHGDFLVTISVEEHPEDKNEATRN